MTLAVKVALNPNTTNQPSKREENTVGKGETSPFLTVFSKGLLCRHEKSQGLFGKGLKTN